MVSCVDFQFMSGSPEYVGDLFLLMADTLSDDLPLMLIRDKAGKLKLASNTIENL